MRVAISAIGYECAEHLNKVLEPWVYLRKTVKTRYQFDISVSHGVFPETHQLGFPLYSTDGTIARLNEKLKDGEIDNFIVAEQPTYERDLRNLTLPYLFDRSPDLLWLLDLSDEIYTPNQILDILDYVEKSDKAWFKINFKNYVFDEYTYVDDFIAPRIWKMSASGARVAGFYYDNEIIYDNGITQSDATNEVIPRDIAFVKHLSWVGSRDYLQRKIRFQHNHYGHCSYKWDIATDRLDFDETFYAKTGLKKPTLYHD